MALPEFLDPLLGYLSDTLPPPLYSLLITFLSHTLALLFALYDLCSSLSTKHLSWDAQTVIPPLIALLSAYLALLSLYRTTTWMLRVGFWFVKWGAILGALVASVAWMMGSGGGNAVGSWGLVNAIGGLVLDMTQANGQGRNAARGPRSHVRKRNRSVQSMKKPRAWDSFEAHREYQEQLGKDEHDLQEIVQNIISTAGASISQRWWGVAAVDQPEDKGKDTRQSAKSTTGSISR